MPPVNREQIRARRAYDSVRRHPEMSEWAERLPIMLQTNGLLATWAHLLSKANDHSAEMVLRTLSEHLWQTEGHHGQPPEPRPLFLVWVGAGQDALTAPRMRKLTEEAVAFAAWLKRAGQAEGGAD